MTDLQMPTTGTFSGLDAANYINGIAAKLGNKLEGATAPTTTSTGLSSLQGLIWLDTSTSPNTLRINDGANWIAIGTLDSVNHLWKPWTIKVQRSVISSSGTYTPVANLVSADVQIVGGGGGSGGCPTTSAGQVAASGGGGGGAYGRSMFSAATIGSSQTVTIGAGGTAGAAGSNAGGNGGTTSVGALISASGGHGSSGGTATGTNGYGLTTSGGTSVSGATVGIPGGAGAAAFLAPGLAIALGGRGAPAPIIGTPTEPVFGSNISGANYGNGAAGMSVGPSTASATAGAAGGPGVCIIEEYYLAQP